MIIPISVLIFAGLFAVAWLLERRTTIGRSIHALGGNQAAARLCGVPLASIRTVTYAISGACAALSGVILTSQVALAVPYQGTGLRTRRDRRRRRRRRQPDRRDRQRARWRARVDFHRRIADGNGVVDISAIWQMVIRGVVIVAAVAFTAWLAAAMHEHGACQNATMNERNPRSRDKPVPV